MGAEGLKRHQGMEESGGGRGREGAEGRSKGASEGGVGWGWGCGGVGVGVGVGVHLARLDARHAILAAVLAALHHLLVERQSLGCVKGGGGVRGGGVLVKWRLGPFVQKKKSETGSRREESDASLEIAGEIVGEIAGEIAGENVGEIAGEIVGVKRRVSANRKHSPLSLTLNFGIAAIIASSLVCLPTPLSRRSVLRCTFELNCGHMAKVGVRHLGRD